jgi:gamma-glutamyltranspeptidase/glutathione hydrolase
VTRLAPYTSLFAPHGMVCAVDHLAAAAGAEMLRHGGSAADAAVAASAVLAVTTQHMCGMGGDLFALVGGQGATPSALNASGRAGSGADPDRLRAEGHRVMPMSGDIRSTPVPGCVDGWLALHSRFGRVDLAEVLAPAISYAAEGFPASPTLALSAPRVADRPGGEAFRGVVRPGDLMCRPGVARTLRAVVEHGRDGFYGGEFGAGLLALGAGEYTESDLSAPLADWVEPLSVEAWGRVLWTVPPNSQGYLALAGAWIASGLPLPADPDDELWAHLLIEAARFAAYDRLEVLHERSSGQALLAPERLAPRRDAISCERAAVLGDGYGEGGTIYLCAVDEDRMAVSLIQSNARGFGSGLAEPATGIFLQNRGIGFSLVPGHPAEYGPGRRPPHTLSPALVTDAALRLDTALGTMGGDSQPQVLLQLLARLLAAGESAGEAVEPPSWILSGGGAGFDTWDARGQVQVWLEDGAPWAAGLRARGHDVCAGAGMPTAGHAHVIRATGGVLEAASDPRALSGAAIGF